MGWFSWLGGVEGNVTDDEDGNGDGSKKVSGNGLIAGTAETLGKVQDIFGNWIVDKNTTAGQDAGQFLDNVIKNLLK
jgi:hypothetical protein